MQSEAPAKRSQDGNLTYRNIFSRSMWCAFGHPFGMSCYMFGVVGSNLEMVNYELTTPNM